MTWLKGQLGTILTAVVLLVSLGLAWGTLATQQQELCRQIGTKADKEAICRELDLIQKALERIEGKIDARTH